jgi:hypothetical protein
MMPAFFYVRPRTLTDRGVATLMLLPGLLNSGRSRYTVIVEDVIVSVPEGAKLTGGSV